MIYYEGNDLSGLHIEMTDKNLTKYYKDVTFTQDLKLKQKEIDNLAVFSINRENEKNKVRVKGFLELR